jgi:hypothetical protein
MPDRPSDVKKKLDELYRKTEDIRFNLIEIHHMLSNTGFFNPKTVPNAPVPSQRIVVPPVVEPTLNPPVVPPPSIQHGHTTPPTQPEPIKQNPVGGMSNEQKKKFEQMQQQSQYIPPKKPTIRPQEERKGFFDRNPDLEKFIGERLITFIGIAVLVIGIAFFVKFAIDKNWINEVGRTAIGILAGGALIAVAHRLRKTYTTFSSVLAGGGIATLYFTVTYAFQVYALFSQPAALGILVVITMFTVMLSVAYNRIELAILAIVGGFASPLMVKTGEGNFIVLCIYMLILDIGMLALAYYKKWNVVNVLSFVFTIVFYSGALVKDIRANQHAHDQEAFLFATLFYLTFFTMNIINNVKARRKFESFEIMGLLTNTGLYYAAGYFLLHHMEMHSMKGLFTLLVATFNTIFAFLLFRRQEVDRNLIYFLVGLAITFVSLAGPVQLEGNHITLFWAAEAALLLWFYYRSKLTVVKTFSVFLNVALGVSTIYNWMMVYAIESDTLGLTSKGLITSIGAVISLAVSTILLYRNNEKLFLGNLERDDYRKTLSTTAMIILFIGGALEMNQVLSRSYDLSVLPVFWASYIVGFLIFMHFTLRPLKMEFLTMTKRISIIVMLFGVVAFPHINVAHIRDSWLLGEPGTWGPYMMHYAYLGGILFLGFSSLSFYNKNEKYTKDSRNLYLWLLTAVTVFLLSAELDHSMVMSFSLNPENPAWSINDVRDNIHHGLTLSHKVGFPILWGICSFAMMIIGMRKKNRQVRIISLVLMGGVVIKLALLGFFGESQSGKIIAFVLCGLILLTVSFMYQKLRKLIMADETSNSLRDEKVA